MTIAVSIQVNDGVVLAADSASTLFGTGPNNQLTVLKIYQNAHKVFNLYKHLPVGIVTFGAGGVGSESVSTLIKDFRVELVRQNAIKKTNYKVGDIAERFKDFFWEKYQVEYGKYPPIDQPAVGFFIAGYSSHGILSEVDEVKIVNGLCERKVVSSTTGILWAGEQNAITRLLKGYGEDAPNVLKRMGIRDEDADVIIKGFGELETHLVTAAMPIQDAIDLARFLVEVTINFKRFEMGAETVGGPVDIAAITKHEGFKWVCQKHYYSSEFNPVQANGKTV